MQTILNIWSFYYTVETIKKKKQQALWKTIRL